MKYIIDLPDDKPILFMDGRTANIITPGKNEMTVFDDNIACAVVKLTPYEKPEYTAEDAWEMARDIYLDDGMAYKELDECFGMSIRTYIFKMPFTEAMEKYEAWKKEKDEIHVGDEVESTTNCGAINEPWIVVRIEGNNLHGIGIKTLFSHFMTKDKVRKTGRHFDEIETLLEKMRNDE